MGGRPACASRKSGSKGRAILATFDAYPVDPGQEMQTEWESAIQIGFDQDRLPTTVPHLGGAFGDNIPWICKEIIRDIREVFQALSPFLPPEPPQW
jgi:hypothetical protein